MHFFVGGILNVYQQWILGGLDSSPDEIMKHLAELILNNKPMYMNWMQSPPKRPRLLEIQQPGNIVS